MRVAQVAPLFESVPPKLYGGTERIVSYLTDELVELGHDVTLFASGDSVTDAKLVPVCDQSLRLDKKVQDWLPYHILMVEKVMQRIHDFDVVHFHIDYIHLYAVKRQSTPYLSTFHGRLDIPDLVPLYQEFRQAPFTSISNAQRRPLPWLKWMGTIYHGIPKKQFTPINTGGDYLAFLGRISPEKGVEQAIEIAKRAGMTLKIAAKIESTDRPYFEAKIEHEFGNSLIEYVGEISDNEKFKFLGDAYAVLFPIQWPEPFGLVMIESFACGTPVIAYPRGSVPEIMQDGVTGYIVENAAEAVEAIRKLTSFDRYRCRSVFEERFTSARMAQDYLEIYQRLINHAKQTAA